MSNKRTLHFFAIEKLTLLYILITTIIILLIGVEFQSAIKLLTTRLLIVVFMALLAFISSKNDLKIIRFLRNVFVGLLLILWYPETFDINRSLINYDHLLAYWEQFIFSCQPALLFSHKVTQTWFCELMNMGYFAYYPLIICTGLYFYLLDIKYFKYFYFTVLMSFFIYYLVYIFFPTAGPQYYYSAIGLENVKSGIFPAVGTYFDQHPVLTPAQTNVGGFFHGLVERTQRIGERPTAAFPSSHVGISTLIVLLIMRYRRRLFLFLVLPVYFVLVCSTVYIQAHYVVDVFAGFITAILLFCLSNAAYRVFSSPNSRY